MANDLFFHFIDYREKKEKKNYIFPHKNTHKMYEEQIEVIGMKCEKLSNGI